MYLKKNEGALRLRNAPTQKATAAHSNSKPGCVQLGAPKPVAVVIGNADELRRIAAAMDAVNADDGSDAAFEILEQFRRKDRFQFTPSGADIIRVAGANGLPTKLAVAAVKGYGRHGKFSAFFAMSWQALKWAEEQRAGDLAASAILHVRASHADKNGRGFVGVPEIAEQLGTANTTVIRADERLVKKGLMEWTKERAGQTLSIKVYQLSLPRSSSATLPLKKREAVAKQQRSSSEAVAKQQRSSSATLLLRDTRARSPLNPEPGTDETIVQPSAAELIVSSHNKDKKDDENVRPGLSRPNDSGEVWEYIFCSDNNEAEALKKYFGQLADDDTADRDIEYWLHMNERRGWRGVTDWRVYLRETFLKGWFPSQQRKAKRRR